MVTKVVSLILSLALIGTAPQLAFAQAPKGNSTAGSPSGPKKQLATILFSGIAGAILGLSTLSFYGRPQEKLSNIAVGFAVGVIIGAGVTTYKAATAPRDFYRGAEFLEEQEKARDRIAQTAQPLRVNWKFEF